jgi:predicted nucleic acid-binding protein
VEEAAAKPELAAVKTWLLDAGPLVAYLDARDPAHTAVASCLDEFTGQLATTSAVITEAMHFISGSQAGPIVLAEFVAATGTRVYDLSQSNELLQAALLMQKYGDTPMDFADATLVLLAEGLNVHQILTLDRRGFSTYRTRRRKHLKLVLDAS